MQHKHTQMCVCLYTGIKYEYNRSLKYLTFNIEEREQMIAFYFLDSHTSIVDTHFLGIDVLDFLPKHLLYMFFFYTLLLQQHPCGSVFWLTFQLD